MSANIVTQLAQVLTFLQQNPIVAALLGGYFLIAFANGAERRLYFSRTWQILIRPTKLDEYTDAPQSLQSFEGWLKKLLLEQVVSSALTELSKSVSENLKLNWKKLTGWLFLIVMLIVFLIADLITIREIASLLGFPINFASFGILSFIETLDYGFAITAGTFFSLIASGFILLEVTGRAEFSNYGEESYNNVRGWIRIGAIFALVTSFVVVIFFGLRAYAVAAVLPDNVANLFNNLAQFGGNVLVRINAFVVTLLIATEAINGLQSIFVIIVLLSILALEIIHLITEILTTLFRIIVDIIYRTFLWLIWTISFWIAKPVDTIVSPLKVLWDKLFSRYIKQPVTELEPTKPQPVKK